jgi:tripartite-type tricarboxylate transporter receptor subunit TctC
MKYSCARFLFVTAALAGLVCLGPAPASSEQYPSKTIKILSPLAPGGFTDILPRILGQKITDTTKQPVVIENRLGGNGAVAGAEVAEATPDGYTLLSSHQTLQAMLPHINSKLRFDPNKDLVPIVHFLTVPNILVIHPSVPAKSLKELIEYAKANPGKLAFGSQAVGSTGHIAGEVLKRHAGIDIVHVPHRGAAPAQNALLGGHVHLMFDTVTQAMELVKDGKLRALGVASAKRVGALSEVPTLAEAGLPLEMSAWFGLMAPRGTPPAVIAWLNQEANKVFSAPDIRDRFISQGATLPLGSPEAFAAHIKAEYEKWSPVIRQASIQIH